MQSARVGLGLLGAALLAAAGCDQPPSGPLADLPTHRLDISACPRLSASPRKPGAPRSKTRRPGLTAEEKRWYVAPGRPWRFIVVHHSATDSGSAGEFDAAHRARGWDELGYHFVIDNGDGGPDGHVEVGPRWRKQKWGAHCGGTPYNEYNNYGIGVCLVGDFRRRRPSPAQLAALHRLLAFLIRTYRVPPANVVGHCDCPNANTECPGAVLHRHIEAVLRPRLVKEFGAAR